VLRRLKLKMKSLIDNLGYDGNDLILGAGSLAFEDPLFQQILSELLFLVHIKKIVFEKRIICITYNVTFSHRSINNFAVRSKDLISY
jgi:hypothetical protein